MSVIDKVKNAGESKLGIVGGFVGDAFNVWSGVSTFNQSQEEGEHIAISTAKGAMDFVIGETLYGAAGFKGMGLGMAATMGADFVVQEMSHGAELQASGIESNKAIGSGHFNMSKSGYTMRQRSLNAIHSNGANIHSAFGNEARNYWLGL